MSHGLKGELLGGRYRVLHPIARGGMGAVYEALDEKLGRRVAVKVLLDELAADPTCAERFRREARAIAAVSHPSLVPIHDLSLEGRPAFLVMELVDGPALREVLANEGRLAWPRAVSLVADVLEALAALHAAGVVHRDLKPANVLVARTHAGRELAKIIDLGVAQLTTGDAYQRLTASGAIVGTPVFMSPEQLAGGAVGPSADVWGAGVLLYAALTGQRPFDGGHVAEILTAIREREPTPVSELAPDVPPAIQHVLGSMLAKEPARRPPSAAHAAGSLRAALVGVPIPLGPTPRPAGRAETPFAPGYAMSPAPGPGALTPPPGERTRAIARTSRASSVAALLAGLGIVTTCAVGVAIAAVVALWRGQGGSLAGEPSSAPPPVPAGLPLPRAIEVVYSGPDGASAQASTGPTLTPQLVACFPDPSRHALTDRMVYQVALDGSGRVTDVQPSGAGATPSEDACVREHIRAAQFPAPSTSFFTATVVLMPVM